MRNIIILSLMCLVGCCPTRHIATSTADSIKVQVIEKIIIDTVEVIYQIPIISERIVTRDTVSLLENKYALTEAKIDHLGYLSHSLKTKPVKDIIKTQIEYITRDSLVFRDREIEKIVEVPRIETWWQRTQRTGFWILLSIIILLSAYKLHKLIKI